MALVKKRTNTTRLYVVAAVIIAVAGIGYLLFQQFFLATPTDTNTTVTPGQSGVITNFGEAILNDSRYTELQPFSSNLNVNANDNPGQPNPFQ